MLPNFKPSRIATALARYDRKQKQRAAKLLEKLATKRQAMSLWQERRRELYVLDGGRCRAYGMPLKLQSENPYTLAHAHHFIYRSAGGTDDLSNLVLLSPEAHRDEHDGLLLIEGQPRGVLTFTKKNLKGQIERVWQSEPVQPVEG